MIPTDRSRRNIGRSRHSGSSSTVRFERTRTRRPSSRHVSTNQRNSGVAFRRPTRDIHDPDLRVHEDAQAGLECPAADRLRARRPGADVTVSACKIAVRPEVDLQRQDAIRLERIKAAPGKRRVEIAELHLVAGRMAHLRLPFHPFLDADSVLGIRIVPGEPLRRDADPPCGLKAPVARRLYRHPSVLHRRAEVSIRGLRMTVRPSRFSLRHRSMSSIRGISR